MPDNLNDDDVFLVFQRSNPQSRYVSMRMTWAKLKNLFSVGMKGDTGPAGTPKRVERYTKAADANGLVTITFTTPFTSVPDGDVVEDWINPTNPQMVTGKVTSISTTGCTAQIMISRGSLLLSTGPFQTAPAGTLATVRVIGN